ncbi:MAG: hypothetical protein HC810_06605 [Acaryochloridaceae cyanobacterium RL_2_7]|nr:hypothetical protein [Acaryochloridaceae cyanobacterium RL_2_7]
MGEVIPERLETYIFCQLLAEVAATIAIDYWYLARIDLEAVVPIGSTLTFLTTTHHQKYEDEYRAAGCDLEIQSPTFLISSHAFIARGCCLA